MTKVRGVQPVTKSLTRTMQNFMSKISITVITTPDDESINQSALFIPLGRFGYIEVSQLCCLLGKLVGNDNKYKYNMIKSSPVLHTLKY